MLLLGNIDRLGLASRGIVFLALHSISCYKWCAVVCHMPSAVCVAEMRIVGLTFLVSRWGLILICMAHAGAHDGVPQRVRAAVHGGAGAGG